MLRTHGPVTSPKASNAPEIGAWAVAGPTGSKVPLLIVQLPELGTDEVTVHPAKVPVSKPPFEIRLFAAEAVAWPSAAPRLAWARVVSRLTKDALMSCAVAA